MARIVKDADIRRDELLDTALALFLEHGYDKTSVEQITNAVGVAKGTFYHYFATKNDLLEQLVARYADQLFDDMGEAMKEAEGSATDRFRLLMAASASAKLGRKQETLLLTESLYTEENRLMLDRMRDGWIDRTRPFIRDIVAQGVAEKTFNIPRDIDSITDLCLSLWFDYGIRVGRLFFEARENAAKLQAMYEGMNTLLFAIERILGAPEGSLGIDFESPVNAIMGND